MIDIITDRSSEKNNIKRGVPQGSCLSPTLFNVIMSDIPHIASVDIGEYADDISIMITGDTIEEVFNKAQTAIQTLETWARTWCLEFNSTKTKSMCFTKKRILEKLEEPELQLKINNENIDWVKTTRYLGVTLDAPTLTWKNHYEELAREGLQRVNIMRAISGTNWGANTELLLNFYKMYIRSKITYGSAATASACQSRQDILERIQNAALRVALGARKTSPIAALQVEANIPPLRNHIQTLNLQYYYRKKAQEDQNPFINQLEEDRETQDKVWTPGVFKKPLVRRIPDITRAMRIPADIQTKVVKIASDPPWNPHNITLKPDLLQETNKEDSPEMKKAAALETINTLYTEHIHMYTDGSKFTESTTAGLWIPDFQHRESWKLKLGQIRSIMGAELFAIDKGMIWILFHQEILTTNKIVLLTDSRAGIEAIRNPKPKHQSHIIDAIKRKAQLLADSNMDITIQWLPSHVGLEGNEEVDTIAKSAHTNPQETEAEIDISEAKALIGHAQQKMWQLTYDIIRPNLHIGPIKTKIQKWPWANVKNRRVETALSRLRIGHVGLNNHLNRFGMSETNQCTTCRVPETVSHFLTECRKYIWSRRKMMTKLARLNVQQPDYGTLLGGGPYEVDVQVGIIKAVQGYLEETGRLGSL